MSTPRTVALVTATVAVAAHPPGIIRTVSLHVATLTVAAHTVAVVITVPKLVASITATGGTDPYGNTYQAGITVYGSGSVFAQLTGGILQFQGSASQSSPAYVATDGVAGILEMSSGTASDDDAPAIIDLVSADANGGQSAINLTSADEVQIGSLVLNGQTITVPQGSAPTVPSAGSSYSETWCTGMETVANFLIAALQDAGIITG